MDKPVTIVMTTYFIHPERVDVAKNALLSWQQNIVYNGPIHLHVADDGSDPDLLTALHYNKLWKRGRVTFTDQYRGGVGTSLNRGFSQGFSVSPYVMYLVDDWSLEEKFDIEPWMYLLQQREDVGIVRLGPPHPHLYGKIEPMTELWQGWALRLDRHGLVVGHRPEIFHQRMFEYYGKFDEKVNAQECERMYSVRWAADPKGPDIVLALPHPWFHIDQADLPSTSHITPGVDDAK